MKKLFPFISLLIILSISSFSLVHATSHDKSETQTKEAQKDGATTDAKSTEEDEEPDCE